MRQTIILLLVTLLGFGSCKEDKYQVAYDAAAPVCEKIKKNLAGQRETLNEQGDLICSCITDALATEWAERYEIEELKTMGGVKKGLIAVNALRNTNTQDHLTKCLNKSGKMEQTDVDFIVSMLRLIPGL
jgi:hypothetical protein